MKKLAFYTNMPTPYQLDFFSALTEYFSLHVIYYTTREKDREWNLPVSDGSYEVIVLNNSWLARLVQRKITSFHFSLGIFGVLFRSKAEYVIVNGTYWSPNVILALLISCLKRKKVFYWNEPLFPEKSRWQFYLKYAMLAPVRLWSDALLAIGKNAITSFSRYGFQKPVYNIPYNINMAAFERANMNAAKLNALKATFKSHGEIVLITSGALVERKGVDTLIKAFLKLPDALKVNFLILGDGAERKAYEELASSSAKIHFLGFRDKREVPYYFALSDIFVFGSRYDGWALVINEAAAADLAIICSDQVGAAADRLSHGQNALICAANDVDGFSAAMQECITNTALRQKLTNGIRADKKYFSSEYIAKELDGIFNNYK